MWVLTQSPFVEWIKKQSDGESGGKDRKDSGKFELYFPLPVQRLNIIIVISDHCPFKLLSE